MKLTEVELKIYIPHGLCEVNVVLIFQSSKAAYLTSCKRRPISRFKEKNAIKQLNKRIPGVDVNYSISLYVFRDHTARHKDISVSIDMCLWVDDLRGER